MSIHRLILLTPYSGPKEVLRQTIASVIGQLDRNDIWIIILDNQNVDEYIYLEKKYEQLTFLSYVGTRGAGNCRNMGLDYIAEKIDGEFLLLPFDGDDTLADFGVNIVKQTMKLDPFNVVSFAHCKIWPDGTQRVIGYSGIFNLRDLLKRYITPCGSTVLKIKNSKILKHFRFSTRFRVNDALFFFSGCKLFWTI